MTIRSRPLASPATAGAGAAENRISWSENIGPRRSTTDSTRPPRSISSIVTVRAPLSSSEKSRRSWITALNEFALDAIRCTKSRRCSSSKRSQFAVSSEAKPPMAVTGRAQLVGGGAEEHRLERVQLAQAGQRLLLAREERRVDDSRGDQLGERPQGLELGPVEVAPGHQLEQGHASTAALQGERQASRLAARCSGGRSTGGTPGSGCSPDAEELDLARTAGAGRQGHPGKAEVVRQLHGHRREDVRELERLLDEGRDVADELHLRRTGPRDVPLLHGTGVTRPRRSPPQRPPARRWRSRARSVGASMPTPDGVARRDR